MLGFIFTFPANRYHATLWGHHVNEARIAWPPEPWRILRALIASYRRKGDHEKWKESDLDKLISALAENLPLYKLPKVFIPSHTLHYMPQGNKKSLIFDAFLQFPHGEELVVAWPGLKLESDLFNLAAHLAEGIGYLGRAESWTECIATSSWEHGKNDLICRPVEEVKNSEGSTVRIIAPLSTSGYAAERVRLIKELEERLREEAESSGKKAPSSKNLEKARDKEFGPTLPEFLIEALDLDTSDYKKYGWNRPPASREVTYFLPSVSSSAPRRRSGRRNVDNSDRHTVGRYILAGRPLPRVEDTIKIGELMRLAALSQFGWGKNASGRRRPNAPSVISGRDSDGKPLRDSSHSHAFWLPEDADGDGWIDHVTVYSPSGLSTDVRTKLDRLTRLWVNAEGGYEDSKDSASLEWRLALEGFGTLENFSSSSRILGTASVWTSATPFLATGHLKASGYPGEVKRLLKRRKIIEESVADSVRVDVLQDMAIGGTVRRATHFHRFRSRGQEQLTDSRGALLRLIFPEPVGGPLCLGYACHFGLGLFMRSSDDNS